MLASLFGDIATLRQQAARSTAAADGADADGEHGFAQTAVLEEAADGAPFNVHAKVGDPHAENLFVTGSPAQAIRDHFRRTRADLDSASHMLSLLDLSRQRAAALLNALSDTTGAPVERLHLREQATLLTLATIERTTVPCGGRNLLKVYHADTRAAGAEEAEIACALMERSQLTAVLLEGVPVDIAVLLLERLEAAVRLSTWRCPLLVFLLAEREQGLAARIRSMAWPASVHVKVVGEPGRGPSGLWNTLRDLWDTRLQASPAVPAVARAVELPDPAIAAGLLAVLAQDEGVHGAALVDGAAGVLLAGETALPKGLAPDLARAALACSLALRGQQHAARTMGLPPVDELSVTAGEHQHIVRAVAGRPGLFLLALLDRKRANVATVRLKLREAERRLA
ncbi:hypothetical protein [Ideonella sp. BN130291]|uniref:hypothetical protein n=1 Tax=Ideonella sp. BN130291 TaxID=3112940 RepID=UPI002E274F3A|nr:hypothetical protein [Ideonella sp. BN130291]